MNARTAVLAAVISLIVVPAHAHHSFAMFDMDKEVTYSGVVADFKWVNPHVHITVDIKAGPNIDPATVGTWDVEGGSINILKASGVRNSTGRKASRSSTSSCRTASGSITTSPGPKERAADAITT